VDEERESLLPIDDDDRNSLAVAAFELLVTRDVDFLEVKRNLGADGLDHAQRALTEVAPLRRVEGQLVPYGYSPRVIVASATRPTAIV
jgi:hypothetical protein